jgi:hypothetical protein
MRSFNPDVRSPSATASYDRVPGGLGIVLGEGGGDEGRDDPPSLSPGVGEDVAHEVDPKNAGPGFLSSSEMFASTHMLLEGETGAYHSRVGLQSGQDEITGR